MKNLKKYFILFTGILSLVSCSDSDNPAAGNVTLSFQNTFGDTLIVLGNATDASATSHTSAMGQLHHFSELKYVISNIRIVKDDGTEIPYNINNLDNGATVINQANPATLNYVLSGIPSGSCSKIKFGLGVRPDLNNLDQVSFPDFYALAGANDTEMHWEWGTGYRFTKIEGFYDTDNKPLSIHTGSTVEGTMGEESTYVQGVNAYRDITLDLPTQATVGPASPKITIKADFHKLLSGSTNTITLGEGNATPSIHTAANMVQFVDNLGGNGASDLKGMFSVERVEN